MVALPVVVRACKVTGHPPVLVHLCKAMGVTAVQRPPCKATGPPPEVPLELVLMALVMAVMLWLVQLCMGTRKVDLLGQRSTATEAPRVLHLILVRE